MVHEQTVMTCLKIVSLIWLERLKKTAKHIQEIRYRYGDWTGYLMTHQFARYIFLHALFFLLLFDS
jgi:hypothetical protein